VLLRKELGMFRCPIIMLFVIERRQTKNIGLTRTGGERYIKKKSKRKKKTMMDDGEGGPVSQIDSAAQRTKLFYSPRCPLVSKPLPNGSGTGIDGCPSIWDVG
jgi:hypothetical protein